MLENEHSLIFGTRPNLRCGSALGRIIESIVFGHSNHSKVRSMVVLWIDSIRDYLEYYFLLKEDQNCIESKEATWE